MYSLRHYGEMIADSVRMDAYVDALRRCVQPGSVVVDIGTGTGIFALLACQLGASKVYAIEPDDAIQVARELAGVNGLADGIEFIQDLSTQVTLPERADVVISDLRGILPLFQKHIAAIVDARKRLLKPGGAQIPLRDTLWVAAVDAPDAYVRGTTPWLEHDYELDMEPVRRRLVHTWGKLRVKPEQLLVKPHQWATLDYTTVDCPDMDGGARWTIERPGTAHGYLVWFDTTVAEGLSFSNSPHHPETIYGAAFLPLSEPAPVEPGDVLSVALRSNLVHDEYVWQWNTSLSAAGDEGPLKAEFLQSTFAAEVVSPAQLRRRSASYVPALNADGEITAFVLEQMRKSVPLGEIATELGRRAPGRYSTWDAALAHAGELAVRYGR